MGEGTTHIGSRTTAPPWRLIARVLGWTLGAFIIAVAIVYLRLLFGPIAINALSGPAESLVSQALPPGVSVDLGGTALSLDGFSPVLRFSPVTLGPSAAGGQIAMDGLEVGFSPLWILLGRPGAYVTLDRPRLQLTQALDGTHLAEFELAGDDATGETMVRLARAESDDPEITIGATGLVYADDAAQDILRSSNDWLAASAETLNRALGDFAQQADAGALARLRVRDASVDMHDPVYGTFRNFSEIDAEIWADRSGDRVEMRASARIGGKTTTLALTRADDGDDVALAASLDNLDFAALAPFLDNPDSMMALRGGGQLDVALDFNPESGAIASGVLTMDLSGAHLRIGSDLFPVAMDPLPVRWSPEAAQFSFADGVIAIGDSEAIIDGDFVTGLDPRFGPIMGMSVRAREVYLQPHDLAPAEHAFDEIVIEGWSTPLYSAVGIDRMIFAREGVEIFGQGRIDSLRQGIGVDMTIAGTGATADDIKRLWPYFFSSAARQWVVDYLDGGRIASGRMRFDFPVGSIALDGSPRPVPEGGLEIDLVGEDIDLAALEGMPPFAVEGQARVSVRDNQFQIGFDRAIVADEGGEIVIANAAFLNQDTSAPQQVFEVSGDVSGAIPTLLGAINREPLDLIDGLAIGYDVAGLAERVSGTSATTVIATLAMDEAGQLASTDYALNGTISDLTTLEPIEGFTIAEGAFSYTASQEGFRINGGAEVQDVPIEVTATQADGGDPDILISSTLNVADAERFGVDLSEYLTGSVRLVARPMSDGTVQLAADLAQTGLTFSDIGIAKPAGQAGAVDAVLELRADGLAVPSLALAFGDVRLEGSLDVSLDGQLRAADFSTFRISPGDDARVALAPRADGFDVTVRGRQLDIKPVLQRFFDLEGTAVAGASDELQDQVLAVDVELERALGYFGTTAYNVDLGLTIRGEDLRRANLTAQLGGTSSVAVTTNVAPDTRTITYASNDVGTVMRFIGIYPRLLGGNGTLVTHMPNDGGTRSGQFVMSDFAIYGEDNLAQVVGTHNESQEVAAASQVTFDEARGTFIQRDAMIEVVDAALFGDTVGGTLRGNIFTEAGQYDLAGTYVPLFGLNNAFAQIPIFGPIFGGREGEGLLGVTFAVRGPLDEPDLLINPVSILAPGVFRGLFEFRSAQNGGQ